jgi:hypothetical protein
MLRIPHCLDNRLTDGGKVVSPTHRRNSEYHIFSQSFNLFYVALNILLSTLISNFLHLHYPVETVLHLLTYA